MCTCCVKTTPFSCTHPTYTQVRLVLSLPMIVVILFCHANTAGPAALAAMASGGGVVDSVLVDSIQPTLHGDAMSSVAHDCIFHSILGMLLYSVERTLQRAQKVYQRHVQELGARA